MNRRDFLTFMGAVPLVDEAVGRVEKSPEASAKINCDRWLELDLYWFDRDRLGQSVAQFLERTYPLYRNVTGWRGVIVNVGWMVDYIAGFDGNLDERIPLGEFDVSRPYPPQERIIDLPRERVTYAPWTYRDLERLGDEFRR